jgi:hypothetical protein
VDYKGILIFASIGEFPLIIVTTIITHMHHVLLGRGGVFFGVTSFVFIAMEAGKQKGNAFFFQVGIGRFFLGVRSKDPLQREGRSVSTTRFAGGCGL